MNYLSNCAVKNQRVLLRCDFNVPISNNKIIDNSKIIKSLDTIKYLLENNNKVIILSHFGRIKTEEDKNSNSLFAVFEELKKYIDIEFIKNPLDLNEVLNVSSKQCFLVENTRYTDVPEKKESVNNLELAKYWASFADVFVIDAFGSMHRAHASTAGISKFLPTYIGFLVQKEIENLKPIVDNPERPFVVIMGGAKVDDKIQIIESLLAKCDKLVLTGGILNSFLKVSGKNIGSSLASNNEEILQKVSLLIKNYKNKLYFSDKFIAKRNNLIEEVDLNHIQDEDIIYDNIVNIKDILKEAKMIFLNGTCGKYEQKEYAKGTINLLKNLEDCTARVFIGGGDTVAAVISFGCENSYEYLSSGGGATLEYVAYGKLKALEWVEKNSDNN